MSNVISRGIEVYGNLKFGKHVRIDHGCIFTGDVVLGDYVHVAPYCVFHGGAGISVGDFSGFSAGTHIYTSCDDFSGETLFGPTVPDECKNVKTVPMEIGSYVITGAKASIVAVRKVPDGVALGGHALLTYEPVGWAIYAGVPAMYLRPRSRDCIKLADELRKRSLRQL